jgi:hypothetical protein
MKRFFNLLVWSIVLSASALAQTADPRIIFSDLQSGPNSGGANNKGAVVTIYGFGFGATRGTSTVTTGGAAAASYLQWSDTKVSFQLGNAAVTGNIVANVSGVASNGMPFTVRPGRLHFVSPTGADTNAGTFTTPWHSLVKAKNTAVAGDVIYLMNGVNQTALESSSASLALSKSGTASLPIALVAYPGATATIGSATGQSYGIRTTAAANYWLLAGLTLRGSFSALHVANSSNWRVVGSDISCPSASGSGACVDFAGATNISMYRNTVHDVASSTGTNLKLYQAVLFETGSTAIDFGWNEIANVRSCRGLQFSSDASPLYNITVRNNLIHDTRCDGINFASVEPSLGAVKAYNNVIYRAGTGPAPNGIESNYACINVGAAGTSAVLVQDNTFYDCGRRANGDSGAISASAAVSVVNNIIYSLTGESYLAPNSLSTRFSGTNNLFFGVGATPAFSTSSLNANPNFTSVTSNNFRPLTGSPAIDKGMNTGINRDIVQGSRPSGTGYDIGAYEYVSSATTPPPPQPGTLTVSAALLAFGSVNTGSSANQNLTLSNNSTAAVSVSAVAVTGTGFTRSAMTLPLTLQPGQSSVLALTFAPQAAGAASGSLNITSNASNSSVSVALSGTGTTPTTPPTQGTLTVSATSLAFGSVVDGSSLAKTVTLSNSSSASVTVSAISAAGTGFTESNPALPLTLATGKTATVTVTFAPPAAASDSGNLQITSNATDASVAIALSGTGTAPAQHSVDVAWDAATPVPAGYNVYRATQSAGPFSKVNASLINGLIFTDSTVTPGATYFYIVTSVGADGTESVFSNQATAVVPNP